MHRRRFDLREIRPGRFEQVNGRCAYVGGAGRGVRVRPHSTAEGKARKLGGGARKRKSWPNVQRHSPIEKNALERRAEGERGGEGAEGGGVLMVMLAVHIMLADRKFGYLYLREERVGKMRLTHAQVSRSQIVSAAAAAAASASPPAPINHPSFRGVMYVHVTVKCNRNKIKPGGPVGRRRKRVSPVHAPHRGRGPLRPPGGGAVRRGADPSRPGPGFHLLVAGGTRAGDPFRNVVLNVGCQPTFLTFL